MPPSAPEFWARRGALSLLLTPLGCLYDAAGTARRALVHAYRAPVPVICVGNLVAGGAGKTPIVADLARRLTARGVAVHILSRGYGGTLPGPVRVDPDRHDAAAVGDEPLMLARGTPTWVARDRAAGARAAAVAGAQAILMDDGLQNPTLAKDLSLIALDGGYGFGNRRVIPAGPLRETIAHGLARADAVVMLGGDQTGATALLDATPVLHAAPRPAEANLAGKALVAFAGIGRPQKFFEHFAKVGARVVAARGFPDHHPYTETELMALAATAAEVGAALITTEKDWVRLAPSWRTRIRYLPLTIAWQDEAAIERLLDRALKQAAHG
ncbi:MAG: tetraacyldisaccharide 4'-kinase [Alphaproteobacteria bacterium]|nr:tetraacyldisaccharide 4'-kinase [Alphaproteobacteria bacterium]